MGKYDIDSVYSDELNTTISELARELWSEEGHDGSTFTDCDFDRIMHRLHSKDGLTSRLRRSGFPIWPTENDDTREKYDGLKLLKLLYRAETPSSQDSARVNVIEMLKNPHLSNFTVEYTQSTAYGEVYDMIYDALHSQASCAAECEQELGRIENIWWLSHSDLTKTIFQPALIQEGNIAFERIKMVSERLLRLSENVTNEPLPFQEPGVMNAMFLLFVRHKVLGYLTELRNIIEQTKIVTTKYDNDLSLDYRARLALNKYSIISWRQIASAERFSRNYKRETDGAFLSALILGTISGGDIFTPETKQHRVNAFRYVRIVANWYSKKYNIDISNGLPPHLLIGIAQTIYSISVGKEQFMNRFLGNKQPKRTLLAALKNGENADAVAILNIECRVTNRVLAIIAGAEMAEKYRSIQTALLKLEEVVFSQTTLESIQAKHNELYSQAVEIIKEITEWKALDANSSLAPFA